MDRMWADIAQLIENDERRAPQRLVDERQRAQRERYEAYMRQHMPPTHRDFGDEQPEYSDGRDLS